MKERPELETNIRNNLRLKIFRMNVRLVAAAIILFALIGALQFRRSGELLEKMNREQNDVIMDTMSQSMQDVTADSFRKYAALEADTLDEVFLTMRHDLEVLASQVQMVLEHPDAVPSLDVPLPSDAEPGTLSLQLLYSDDADPSDPALKEQIRRIGGLRNMLLEIVEGSTSLQDCIVTLPGGASVLADRIPESKVQENGELIHYNADRRPWYMEALARGKPCFTSVKLDNYLNISEVMAGVPVYIDGELAAVCGGSVLIRDLEKIISRSQLGELRTSCLINENGNILYSSRQDGELGMSSCEGKSLKESGSPELVSLVSEALSGGSGFTRLTIDGADTYVAYAPLRTVGWSLLLTVPEEELNRTAYLLTEQTDAVTENSIAGLRSTTDRTIRMTVITAAVLILLAIITSLLFADRLVQPIKRMTMRISEMRGKDMDFEVEDIYLTNDEIEVLARAFSDMSEKMQGYVQEIVQITAEKQRIDTELHVASEIQANMLPSRFPAFPDRKEFDLHAIMNTAKEVGGDFYDFFLIDDDHLALVIADVSGKSVPAALFMVVSRTVLKNVSLSGSCNGPGEILKAANDILCEGNEDDMFVTAWLGILTISTGRLVYTSAGHEYPVFYRKGSGFMLKRSKNSISLGAMEDIRCREIEWQMQPGDLLFLYTDGIPEAINSRNEFFGIGRMMQALKESWDGCDMETLLLRVRERVDAYAGDVPQFDDMTMMCLRYNGKKA